MAANLSELTRRLVALAAVPVLLAFLASDAQAQDGAIAGQVVSAQDAQPVVGAQVYIEGTQFGTLTGEDGRYTITGIPADDVILQVRLIGFGQASQEVTVQAGETVTVDFELRPRAITMDELVVTGVAAQTMRAKVPFDVATVTNEQMPVPSTTASGMLQGKVPGVTVVSGSGRPGSAPAVLLRGATSINASGRSQEPLYIVDGVIMGSSMADLGSLDIKNIEVVKGAAAASLYGSRAQNGVIQITTEDGAELQEGTVNYTLRTEYGGSGLEGEFFLPQSHEFALTEDGTGFVQSEGTCTEYTACTEAPPLAGNAPWREAGESANSTNTIMSNPWPGQTYDQVDLAMSDGNFSESYLSVTGRSGATNFHGSFAYTDEEGILPGREGFQRYNVRLNVDQRIQDELTVAASAFYSTSTQDNFQSGIMFDLTRMKAGVNLRGCVDDLTQDCLDDPDNLILTADPFNTESANPLYQTLVQEDRQERGRFLGSADVEYEPLDWLSVQGNISYDRLDREDENFFPQGYRTIDPAPGVNEGFLSKFDLKNESLNASVTANLNFELTDQISNTTRLRYLFEREDSDFNNAGGNTFAVAGVPTLGNLDESTLFVSSGLEPIRSDGYFIITNFDISDRYVVDVLARNDGSSLFGPDERRHWYYRAAGAWRVAQEDWFDLDAVDELKLRYSYGTAGGRPDFDAQYETYNVGGGRVTPVNLGNRDLSPEFSQEHEAGLDAILFDRFVLGATYARTVTDDQILPVPLPSFSGFGTQWRNAGELTSNSWEFSLQASVVESQDFSWSSRVSWDRTRSEITRLDVPAFRGGVGGQGLGNVFFYREGEELGTFYGAQFARNCSHLPDDVSCDGFTVDENGFLVWVGDGSLSDNDWGESSDVNVRGAPVDWGTPFRGECTDRVSGESTLFCEVGSTTPDYSLSFSNTVNWGGFSLYALLHTEQGFDVYNQPLEWAVFRRQGGMYDESGTPPEQAKPLSYYDQWYHGANGLAPDDEFVEDGSYVKLREVSARYRFDAEQLDAVPGLSAFSGMALELTGRNLLTWTDYRGFDPEVGIGGGTTGSAVLARVAGYQYPNFRTWTAGIELNF